MEKLRYFEESGIGAMCFLAGQDAVEYLEMDEFGVISLPEGCRPTGFFLVVFIPKRNQIVLAQRDLSRHHGDYRSYRLGRVGEFLGPDYEGWVLNSSIEVRRAGNEVWLPWKGETKGRRRTPSNKVDCWIVAGNHVDLFQVGIVTHDNGQSFHLLGEYRWRGELFQNDIGKPDDPVWGTFGARQEIFDNPNFKRLLPSNLPLWKGREEELNPPLDPVPENGLARVQWYSPFAGQTGQGPVKLSNGSAAWVHGADIFDPSDPDGIHRLQRNDLLRYAGTAEFGEKTPQTKLLCVERVR